MLTANSFLISYILNLKSDICPLCIAVFGLSIAAIAAQDKVRGLADKFIWSESLYFPGRMLSIELSFFEMGFLQMRSIAGQFMRLSQNLLEVGIVVLGLSIAASAV